MATSGEQNETAIAAAPQDIDDSPEELDDTISITPATQRDGSVRDISYHPGKVVLYSPPKQRQQWGDSQILPRVNWGHTFFDLFFVAAAYNVGNIVVVSPTGHGVLYFVTCFFISLAMWRDKVFYDARFVVDDDLYHRFVEAMLFVVVAFGIVHINPVPIMANPREHPDMFAVALVATIFTCLSIVVYLEIYFNGVGQREVLKKVAIRDIRIRLVAFALQVAATIVAGMEYFVHGTGASDYRMLAASQADSSTSSYQNDLPIYLLLGAILSQWTLLIISVQIMSPKDGSHKDCTVPLNISLVIHRDGEWIMLMLGESILSLLIVDVSDGEDYYMTFYCGILTVVSLHYLHYRSQPHDADDHATRRHKDAGVWWGMVNAIYSASLIAVGVSYKLFMYEFTYGERRLEDGEHSLVERDLAAGEGLTSDERQQAAANVFSASMSLVFVCLDVMILLHRGLVPSISRCRCPKTKVTNWSGIILTFARICLALFFVTLSQYATNPQYLSVLGLAGVVVQLIIRKLGCVIFLDREKDEAEDNDCEGGKMQVDSEEKTLPKVPNEEDDVSREDVAGHETNEVAHEDVAGHEANDVAHENDADEAVRQVP